MRHSSTLSPSPRRLPRRRRDGSLALASLLGVALLAAAGCVTQGRYSALSDSHESLKMQNRQMTERVQRLETSNEILDAERVALIEDLEDLVQEHGSLTADVARLRETESALATSLAEHELALGAQTDEVNRLQGTYTALVSELEQEVASGQIEISQLREGLMVNVSQEILFSSGSAELNQEGRSVLRRVSLQLRELTHAIEVQGHSDSDPISGTLKRRYPSNWELAGARAASVVRLFREQGVAGERLTAVSFAEFNPVAPNDTAEDRALNRRIEIRLQPSDAAGAEADVSNVVDRSKPATPLVPAEEPSAHAEEAAAESESDEMETDEAASADSAQAPVDRERPDVEETAGDAADRPPP